MARPKKPVPKFRVGEVVNLPIKITKVDRRFSPTAYHFQGLFGGWMFSESVIEKELEPRESGKRGCAK
jgi:hypothetical protein